MIKRKTIYYLVSYTCSWWLEYLHWEEWLPVRCARCARVAQVSAGAALFTLSTNRCAAASADRITLPVRTLTMNSRSPIVSIDYCCIVRHSTWDKLGFIARPRFYCHQGYLTYHLHLELGWSLAAPLLRIAFTVEEIVSVSNRMYCFRLDWHLETGFSLQVNYKERCVSSTSHSSIDNSLSSRHLLLAMCIKQDKVHMCSWWRHRYCLSNKHWNFVKCLICKIKQTKQVNTIFPTIMSM